MGTPVELKVEGSIAELRLSREHGNAINEDLVDGLLTACRQVESDPRVRAVLLAADGKLFCPGLDLQELIELDRPAVERFLGRFNACVLSLYTLSKPVLAALHGHAVAGGCVLSLTADWRVLREGARVGLNEVRVGVPFPFGVAMILLHGVSPSKLDEIALLGRNYSGADAVEAGLVHEVFPAGKFEEICRERLDELASKDARAFAITKRYLRSATVERIRANDAQFASDFLDAWFSDETRQRIRAIVDQLRSK